MREDKSNIKLWVYNTQQERLGVRGTVSGASQAEQNILSLSKLQLLVSAVGILLSWRKQY